MNIRLSIAALIMVTVSGWALAATPPYNVQKEIQRGQQLFEHGLYNQSVEVFKKLLNSYKLKRMEDIVAAHTNLGAAYFHLGDELHAREHFQSLVNFNPEIKLDPTRYSPKVVELLENVKTLNKSGTPPTPLVLATANRINSNEKRLLAFSTTEPATANILPALKSPTVQTDLGAAESNNQLFYRFIPFGVGQFQNKQKSKGFFFLAIEGLALGAAISSTLLFDSEKNADGTFNDPELADTYRTAFFSSIISFAVMSVAGIVDSIIVYNKQTTLAE